MVDLQQVKIWSLDDYRYLQSLYTYSIAECDFKPQQINKIKAGSQV